MAEVIKRMKETVSMHYIQRKRERQNDLKVIRKKREENKEIEYNTIKNKIKKKKHYVKKKIETSTEAEKKNRFQERTFFLRKKGCDWDCKVSQKQPIHLPCITSLRYN